MHHKEGHVLLQYETGLMHLLQKRANVITKWDKWYYKLLQVLQSRSTFITKLGNYYKVRKENERNAGRQ